MCFPLKTQVHPVILFWSWYWIKTMYINGIILESHTNHYMMEGRTETQEGESAPRVNEELVQVCKWSPGSDSEPAEE